MGCFEYQKYTATVKPFLGVYVTVMANKRWEYVMASIDMTDVSGLEFNKSTILGTDEMVFRALITQHFGKQISDDDYFNVNSAHLE